MTAVVVPDVAQRPRSRTASRDVPWGTVLAFGAVLALADWFWVVALGGAVGSIERSEAPFGRWVRGSVVLLPVFALAVLVALMLARRWLGPVLRRPRAVVAAALLVAATASVTGIVTLVASAAYDYRLQIAQLDKMSTMGAARCVGQCLTGRQEATLDLQLQAGALGCLLLLATNVLLVGWMVALRGGTLNLERAVESPGESPDSRPWRAEVQRLLVAALVGASTVQLAFAAERLSGLVTTSVLVLVLLAVAELVCAGLRPGRLAWVVAAMLSGGLVVLGIGVHLAGGRPVAAGSGGLGLAEGAADLLGLGALAAALVLLTGPRWLRRPPASEYTRRLALVAVVAVTAVGLGGSGLAALDLGGVSGDTRDHGRSAH